MEEALLGGRADLRHSDLFLTISSAPSLAVGHTVRRFNYEDIMLNHISPQWWLVRVT